jgi:hypothetical protein
MLDKLEHLCYHTLVSAASLNLHHPGNARVPSLAGELPFACPCSLPTGSGPTGSSLSPPTGLFPLLFASPPFAENSRSFRISFELEFE